MAALIKCIDDWLKTMESGKEICAVLFDYRKAFNSVSDLPLLAKLEDLGTWQARRQGGGGGGCRGVHMHPPFFSLIISCHFTEVLNCLSNRLRLHAILLTKPHLVQLINITPQSISSCDQYMHNYYSSHFYDCHVTEHMHNYYSSHFCDCHVTEQL